MLKILFVYFIQILKPFGKMLLACFNKTKLETERNNSVGYVLDVMFTHQVAAAFGQI